MKCPNCGYEIGEGKLLCERCATEIKIVPDFEPEIETKIEETLSDVANLLTEDNIDSVLSYSDSTDDNDIIEEINPDDIFLIPDEELPEDDFWDVEDVIDISSENSLLHKFTRSFKRNNVTKIIVFACALICLCCIVMTIGMIVNKNRTSTFEYKYEKATSCYADGNYSDAVYYLEQAILADNSDRSLKYLLADYYIANSQTENAILTLKDLIANPDEKVNDAYDKLFKIYSDTDRVSEIVNCLSNCNDTAIIEKYQRYLAYDPEFGSPEGSYDSPIYLKITANTSGSIYYTLDGTDPTVESTEYTSPIFLEMGYYTIKAVFVNNYGISSQIVSGIFDINSSMPTAPVVLTEPGDYTLPTNIELELEDEYIYSTYYTTDGSVPTKDSLQYRGPILMPLGISVFSFVSYNIDDIASEVVQVSYSLNLEGATVSPEEAVNFITNYRFSLGGMVDLEGHLDSIGGRLLYICNSAAYINGDVFYVIDEEYEDPNTLVRTRTGLSYGVCIHDINSFGSVEVDENNNYYLH